MYGCTRLHRWSDRFRKTRVRIASTKKYSTGIRHKNLDNTWRIIICYVNIYIKFKIYLGETFLYRNGKRKVNQNFTPTKKPVIFFR